PFRRVRRFFGGLFLAVGLNTQITTHRTSSVHVEHHGRNLSIAARSRADQPSFDFSPTLWTSGGSSMWLMVGALWEIGVRQESPQCLQALMRVQPSRSLPR